MLSVSHNYAFIFSEFKFKFPELTSKKLSFINVIKCEIKIIRHVYSFGQKIKQTNKIYYTIKKKIYTTHFFNVDVIYNFNSLTNEHFTSKLMVARAFSTVA